MTEIAPLPDGITPTGGGRFDRSQPYLFFMAGNLRNSRMVTELYPYHLIAVNEIGPAQEENFAPYMQQEHMRIFLDSGVFSLAIELARARNLSFSEVRSLPPGELPGYAALKKRYVALARRFASDLWGYVEIDIGSAEQKTQTRRELEALGLAPTPVYHPLTDGWDYFDDLAAHYDRICVANIGQSSADERLRILATAWERRRRYPHLWIHLLGIRQHVWLSAFPANSSDSSSWTQAYRYGRFNNFVDDQSLGDLPITFTPRLQAGSGQASYEQSLRLVAYQLALDRRSRLAREDALRSLGFSLLAPTERSFVRR